jgi:hypothetical protein
MPDTHKAMRNDMHGKTPDELPMPEFLDLYFSFIAVVFVSEFYFPVSNVFYPVITYGNAVGVSSDVIEHLSWAFFPTVH